MPTLTELRDVVVNALGIGDHELEQFGGNLEQWMSFIALDQPWLNAADNLSNRSLFERVRTVLADAIVEAEERAVAADPPDWLLRLVWTWCENEAAVFTFNYDTLVERCLASFGRVQTFADIYAAPLMERVAAGDGAVFGAEEPHGPTLKLFKLHGSVNWAFGGLGAPPNDRIVLTDSFLPWAPRVSPDRPPALRYQSRFGDLTPLIIPPTYSKGPYYSNLSLRAQWTQAAVDLSTSTNLTVVGYSFPSGDLTAGQWVSSSFRGWRMDIVDRDQNRPAEIRARLAGEATGQDSTGDDALTAYVERECGPLVRWNLKQSQTTDQLVAELFVNGVDVIAANSGLRESWANDYQLAQRWIYERVQAAAPSLSIGDRAVGPMSASFDARYVVLPKGAKVVTGSV